MMETQRILMDVQVLAKQKADGFVLAQDRIAAKQYVVTVFELDQKHVMMEINQIKKDVNRTVQVLCQDGLVLVKLLTFVMKPVET